MGEVLAAHVTDDALQVLPVRHRQVDLNLRLRAEGLSAGRTKLVLYIYPVPALEMSPQTLGRHDLAAFNTNALRCSKLF